MPEDNAKAIIDFAKENAKGPTIEEVELGTDRAGPVSATFFVYGDKYMSLHDYFERWSDYPRRARGTTELLTLDSFIDWCVRHGDPGGEESDDSTRLTRSVVYANTKQGKNLDFVHDPPQLVCVVNHHDPVDDDGVSKPDWGDFKAVYSFPISQSFLGWWNAKSEWMSTSVFAAFLEDRVLDVVQVVDEPTGIIGRFQKLYNIAFATPIELVQLARGLTVYQTDKVADHRNTDDGSIQITYESKVSETRNAIGDRVQVPSAFVIDIAVFEGGPLYRIPAKLRYRRSAGGSIEWQYVLFFADRVFRDAVRIDCEKVKDKTELQLLYGMAP